MRKEKKSHMCTIYPIHFDENYTYHLFDKNVKMVQAKMIMRRGRKNKKKKKKDENFRSQRKTRLHNSF